MSDTIDLSTLPFDKVCDIANEWRSLAKQERAKRLRIEADLKHLQNEVARRRDRRP